MHKSLLVLAVAVCCLTGCSKLAGPASTASVPAPSSAKDAVEQKLLEYSGAGSTDCGRLDVRASVPQLQTASGCAMQASRDHRPFHLAYDMPGMTVAVAGNSDGKMFSVQAQGTGTDRSVTSSACPAQLRVASSGRISCFPPGEMMGSMGPGHGSMGMPGGGMANPHAGGSSMQPGKKQ